MKLRFSKLIVLLLTIILVVKISVAVVCPTCTGEKCPPKKVKGDFCGGLCNRFGICEDGLVCVSQETDMKTQGDGDWVSQLLVKRHSSAHILAGVCRAPIPDKHTNKRKLKACLGCWSTAGLTNLPMRAAVNFGVAQYNVDMGYPLLYPLLIMSVIKAYSQEVAGMMYGALFTAAIANCPQSESRGSLISYFAAAPSNSACTVNSVAIEYLAVKVFASLDGAHTLVALKPLTGTTAKSFNLNAWLMATPASDLMLQVP